MSRGTDTALGGLHGLLTEYYINRLDSEMKLDAADMIPLSPAELTAMNNFLKQNDITCLVEESHELSALQQKLQDKQKHGRAKLAAVSSITGE